MSNGTKIARKLSKEQKKKLNRRKRDDLLKQYGISERSVKALAKEQTKNRVGRPEKYTKELAKEVLDRIASGESLLEITQDDHIPNYRTIMRWRLNNTKFSHNYAQARAQQAETWVEQLIYLAKTEEDVNRARLISDNMKWSASKLLPKMYGDHVDVEQNINVTFNNGVPRPRFIESDTTSDIKTIKGKNTDS